MDVYSAKGITKVRLIRDEEPDGITVVTIGDTARIYLGILVDVKMLEEVEA